MNDNKKHSNIWSHFNNFDNTRAESKVYKIEILYKAGFANNLQENGSSLSAIGRRQQMNLLMKSIIQLSITTT